MIMKCDGFSHAGIFWEFWKFEIDAFESKDVLLDDSNDPNKNFYN